MSPAAVAFLIAAYAALVVAITRIRPISDGDRVRDRYHHPEAAQRGTVVRRWPHAALVAWDDGTRTMHDPDHLRRLKP